MPYRCNQCPQCGRCQNCGGLVETLPAQGRGCNRPGGAASLPQELYAGRASQPRCVTCCDPYSGCRQCDLRSRNAFWPGFCHPRWLPCGALYSCRRR